MEKTVFKNQTFLTLLVTGILILFVWNLVVVLTTSNFLALIPMSVQVVVLALILTKNKHAKLSIKILAIVMIAGPSLSILGKTIKVLLGDEIIPQLLPLMMQIILLFLGLTINHFNNTTVTLESIQKPN